MVALTLVPSAFVPLAFVSLAFGGALGCTAYPTLQARAHRLHRHGCLDVPDGRVRVQDHRQLRRGVRDLRPRSILPAMHARCGGDVVVGDTAGRGSVRQRHGAGDPELRLQRLGLADRVQQLRAARRVRLRGDVVLVAPRHQLEQGSHAPAGRSRTRTTATRRCSDGGLSIAHARPPPICTQYPTPDGGTTGTRHRHRSGDRGGAVVRQLDRAAPARTAAGTIPGSGLAGERTGSSSRFRSARFNNSRRRTASAE